MSRLRVRDQRNTRWIDICQSEWFVRNAANTAWRSISPRQGIKVRHGSEKYWLDIDCNADEGAVCGEDQYGGTVDGLGSNGSGTPNPDAVTPGTPGTGTPGTGTPGTGTPGTGTPGTGTPGTGTPGTGTPGTGTPGTGTPGTGTPGTGTPGTGDSGSVGSVGGVLQTNPNEPTNPSYTNHDLGSGSGVPYSGGYSDETGYVPGYDLPDSGGDGAGLISSGGDPSNPSDPGSDPGSDPSAPGGSSGEPNSSGSIYRPGLNTYEPYNDLNEGPCAGSKAGSLECPLACPTSTSHQGKGIWEFYVELGSEGGPVGVSWSAVVGASFDIYYRGQRVASTEGRRVGSGVLDFVYVPEADVTTIFVRVRTSVNSAAWMLKVACPSEEEEEGSLVDPLPCKGTFKSSGSQGTYEFFHNMGDKPGEVVIHYQMWNQPDKIDVFDWRGDLLATTGGYVSGEDYLVFQYTPSEFNYVRVRIQARDPGTAWAYLISCPEEQGSKLKPRPCSEDGAVQSGGAGVTDTFIDLGSEPGKVGIRYQMWAVPDTMDVYQDGMLVATTGGPVTGEDWLYFDYDPAGGSVINVRVTGEGNTTWAFLHTCPGDLTPKLSVDEPSVLEGSEDAPGKLCWNVTLNPVSSEPVTVDYITAGGDANPLVAQGKILASDSLGNPFVAVVEQPNAGRAVFDGGFPKFYNGSFTEPMSAPSGDLVFNTWHRTAAGNYYTSMGAIPAGSQALQWILDNGDFRCTINSSQLLTFLSPNAFGDYTFAATLSSTESDDDLIGLVAASTRVGNNLFQLLALRHGGGVGNFGGKFALTFVVNGAVSRVLGSRNIGSSGGWSGRSTRVEVKKDCDKISVRCTDFNSSAYDPASLIEFDLSSDSELNELFNRDTQWGFCTYSQDRSLFSNIFLSGIGLNPNFTYLKNAALWAMKPGNTQAILLSDSPLAGSYSVGTGPAHFGVGIPRTLQSVGFTTEIMDGDRLLQGISRSDLQAKGLIVFMASHGGSNYKMSEASLANIMDWVKSGGGLIVISDHDVFQTNANLLATQFNVEFYGDINRSPVPVSSFVASYGEHPLWEGLACKSISAGGSEGGIRLREIRSDYVPVAGTLTFAPGETSKEVCVDLIGNSVKDPNRTIELQLSNPQGGEIEEGKDKGVGTIVDDDNPICAEEATLPVYANGGFLGPHGADVMHVQSNYACAAGNTMYAMRSKITFPATDLYVFTLINDDDFELYIDCEKVASGPIGQSAHTINVKGGERDVILQYKNVPHCTPGYAGFSILRHGNVMYVTKKELWKGLAKPI